MQTHQRFDLNMGAALGTFPYEVDESQNYSETSPATPSREDVLKSFAREGNWGTGFTRVGGRTPDKPSSPRAGEPRSRGQGRGPRASAGSRAAGPDPLARPPLPLPAPARPGTPPGTSRWLRPPAAATPSSRRRNRTRIARAAPPPPSPGSCLPPLPGPRAPAPQPPPLRRRSSPSSVVLLRLPPGACHRPSASSREGAEVTQSVRQTARRSRQAKYAAREYSLPLLSQGERDAAWGRERGNAPAQDVVLRVRAGALSSALAGW